MGLMCFASLRIMKVSKEDVTIITVHFEFICVTVVINVTAK